MSPDFIKGLDMLRQMQALTGCCDTQPPVVVYRDRHAQSRRPLSTEQVRAIAVSQWGATGHMMKNALESFARAIERAHGITGEGS